MISYLSNKKEENLRVYNMDKIVLRNLVINIANVNPAFTLLISYAHTSTLLFLFLAIVSPQVMLNEPLF